MSEIVLSVEKLSLRSKKKVILDQISLEIEAGESLALIGHNGAGKTSLFQTILGFRFPSQGSFTVCSKKEIGYVPERPYLHMTNSLQQALLFLGQLSGLTRSDVLERQVPLLKRFHLESSLHQRLNSFSKGMLQKTLLIQAILHDPKFLILDEPMSGLDPGTRKEVKDFISEWRAAGKAVLFSTHTTEDLEGFADQVVELVAGKIHFSGTVTEWRQKQ